MLYLPTIQRTEDINNLQAELLDIERNYQRRVDALNIERVRMYDQHLEDIKETFERYSYLYQPLDIQYV